MDHNFSSDKPVKSKDQDRFQRYNFANRIAETINQRENPDGIVIGLYGAWGEGKTSVLNFIEEELRSDERILQVKFNPWRYSDEDSLLKSFLTKVANVLGKELENRKEKLGNFISKYGGIGSVLGFDVLAIGKSLAEINLEELKERVDDFLKESTNKLVIFIDDIDRLDKQEIYALFRLIKLTADFSNTTYILSFDEAMVASAIGERFGEGNRKSGENFLEKIIQVPLKIPQAQSESLKKYCFELVDKAINESQLKISKDEVQRYVSEFSENVLLRLKNPRLVVRYGNSLSFAIPLLKGEVNHVDLMLIEALKIFYPHHYEFVKHYPHYFLSSYSGYQYGSSNSGSQMKDELSAHLDELSVGLSKKEKEAVFSLLKELFPRLNEAFENTFQHEGHKKWFRDKRIVSTSYFKRYFSYTVIEGELSDVSFEAFINSIQHSAVEDIIHNIKEIISNSSVDTFLIKVRSFDEDMNWETAKNLSKSLAIMGDEFKGEGSFFSFGFDSPKSQAAIFIYQLLKKHGHVDESLELAKELMNDPVPFNFAYELNNWLRTGKNDEDKIFTTQQYQELATSLRERALQESKELPLFEEYPDCIGYLFGTWHEAEPDRFHEYLYRIIDDQPLKVKELLVAFTPVARSSSHPEPYKTNFTNDQYKYLTSIVDKDYIYKKIVDGFGDELKDGEVKFFDYENEQTDINILKQFEYWYKKEDE